MFRAILRPFLSINPAEAAFEARGFGPCDPVVRGRLEAMLHAFVEGFNQAVQVSGDAQLARKLEEKFDNHHVGFAFEGVGMYFALLDLLLPARKSRLGQFTTGVGKDHDYISMVGAGFAVARLPWGLRALDRYAAKLDPGVAWCVPCGYGFHQGYFYHRRFIDAAEEPPASLSLYSRQLFDNGIGRSLWWVKASDPGRIRAAIEPFPQSRKPELWAGVGIAAAYAGGLDADGLRELCKSAGPFQPDFLSGVPFSARLRQKAHNHSAITDLACEVLLGMSTEEAANLAAAAAEKFGPQLQGGGITAAYALVRRQLLEDCSKAIGGRVTQ